MKDENILTNDQIIEIIFKRSKFLPRFIDDFREGKTVKACMRTLYKGQIVNEWYRILPGESLAGERPRSLFITKPDGSEVVYKMIGCKDVNGYQEMTFQRMDK